jgi:hypothetical protein
MWLFLSCELTDEIRCTCIGLPYTVIKGKAFSRAQVVLVDRFEGRYHLFDSQEGVDHVFIHRLLPLSSGGRLVLALPSTNGLL